MLGRTAASAVNHAGRVIPSRDEHEQKQRPQNHAIRVIDCDLERGLSDYEGWRPLRLMIPMHLREELCGPPATGGRLTALAPVCRSPLRSPARAGHVEKLVERDVERFDLGIRDSDPE